MTISSTDYAPGLTAFVMDTGIDLVWRDTTRQIRGFADVRTLSGVLANKPFVVELGDDDSVLTVKSASQTYVLKLQDKGHYWTGLQGTRVPLATLRALHAQAKAQASTEAKAQAEPAPVSSELDLPW